MGKDGSQREYSHEQAVAVVLLELLDRYTVAQELQKCLSWSSTCVSLSPKRVPCHQPPGQSTTSKEQITGPNNLYYKDYCKNQFDDKYNAVSPLCINISGRPFVVVVVV